MMLSVLVSAFSSNIGLQVIASVQLDVKQMAVQILYCRFDADGLIKLIKPQYPQLKGSPSQGGRPLPWLDLDRLGARNA